MIPFVCVLATRFSRQSFFGTLARQDELITIIITIIALGEGESERRVTSSLVD